MPGKRNRSVLMSVLLLVGNQDQPDAFVVGILGYAFRFDGLGIEARPPSSTSKTQSSRKIRAERSGALSPRARTSASRVGR